MILRVSPAEFAKANNLHEKTVQGMCRSGMIVARKIARSWQIDVEASERALSLKYGNAAERDLARRR